MMRIHSAIIVLVATPLAAQQQPRQLTADDYARAEKFLSATAAALVPGIAGKATWLSSNRVWYVTTVPNGSQCYIVDPARKSREQCSPQDTLPRSRNTDSSSVSPDGKTAVYIKQFNLWARDLTSGAERQLTSDGI
jgi:Tol biopolymer transport system component